MDIYLTDNELKTLTEDTFRNLYGYGFGLALEGNVMECCSLGWMKEQEYNFDLYMHTPFNAVGGPFPNCTDGSYWETLDPDNLPPCTGPIDMVCAESLSNPQCLSPAPNPACTQTGRSLDCSSKNLNFVPYGIDPVTKKINLANNNIASIIRVDFAGLSSVKQLDMQDNDINSLGANVLSEMSNLKVLMLSGNKIASVDPNALQGVPKLRKLDLSSNEIVDLPADLFAPVAELRQLFLGNNNIGSLDSQLFQYTLNLKDIWLFKNPLGTVSHDLFKNLSSLKVLKLRKTDLASLPVDLLSDLISLKWLDLRGNSLTTLTSTHMQNIPLSPQSTFILEIGDNPLVCCPDMLFLKNAADAGGVIWWKRFKKNSSPPQCTDTPWDTLNTVCTS